MGESELILGILGAKDKYFQGAEELLFRDLWRRAMHYFREQGSTDPLVSLNKEFSSIDRNLNNYSTVVPL